MILGYVVVEINQASHQAERVADDDIHQDIDTAASIAGDYQLAAENVGRRERYVIAQLIEEWV